MKRKIEDRLKEWNRQIKPLPLMLLGARQTGKTYILDDFCKKNFEYVIQLNFFENAELASLFQQSLKATDILERIELYFINRQNNISTFTPLIAPKIAKLGKTI
jgi:predicted AAA+ superfamily ATPase